MITHPNDSDLHVADRQLLRDAIAAQELSYAPYSRFRVGSALRTTNGSICRGANQENASYPLCICGERVALFNKAIHFPTESVEVIAITVSGGNDLVQPAPPCGACLQVMSEFEQRHDQKMRILLQASGPQVYEFNSVSELLPVQFNRDFLITVDE